MIIIFFNHMGPRNSVRKCDNHESGGKNYRWWLNWRCYWRRLCCLSEGQWSISETGMLFHVDRQICRISVCQDPGETQWKNGSTTLPQFPLPLEWRVSFFCSWLRILLLHQIAQKNREQIGMHGRPTSHQLLGNLLDDGRECGPLS